MSTELPDVIGTPPGDIQRPAREATSTLVEEIRNGAAVAQMLYETCGDTGHTFAEVHHLMLALSEQNCKPCHDDWTDIQETFRTLLIESRQSALDVALYIQEFVEPISTAMRAPELSRERKQELLQQFMDGLCATAGRRVTPIRYDGLWNYTFKFAMLASRVLAHLVSTQMMARSLRPATSDQDVCSDTKTHACDELIRSQTSSLAQWPRPMGFCAITTAAILLVLSLICSQEVTGIIIAELVTIGSSMWMSKDRDGEHRAQKLTTDEHRTVDAVGALTMTLEQEQLAMKLSSCDRQMMTIAHGLKQLKNTWSLLAVQVQLCENHLRVAIDDGDTMFESDVECVMRECFCVLWSALDEYVKLVG